MTRETKIGLLVGLGIVLLIGIIVSDHLSAAGQPGADAAARRISTFEPEDQSPGSQSPAARSESPSSAGGSSSSASGSGSSTIGQPEASRRDAMAEALPIAPAPEAIDQSFRSGERRPTAPGQPSPSAQSPTAPAQQPSHQPLVRPVRRTTDVVLASNNDSSNDVISRTQRLLEQLDAAHGGSSTTTSASEPGARAATSGGRSDAGMLQRPINPPVGGSARTVESQPESTSHVDMSTRSSSFLERLRELERREAQQQSGSGAAVAGGGVRHTVKPGESLWDIAAAYYSDGTKWTRIKAANADKVMGEATVQAGEVLVIPAADTPVSGAGADRGVQRETPQRWDAPRANEAVSTATWRAPDEGERDRGGVRSGDGWIEVKSGDSLSELAAKHLGSGSRWNELYEANRDTIDDPHRLKVGMRLRLPGSSSGAISRRGTTSGGSGSWRRDEPGGSEAERNWFGPAAARRTSQAWGGRADASRAMPADRVSATYTVRPGDSLWKIAAAKLGSGERWDEIYQLNRHNLSSASKLAVGLVLVLPAQ